jgi:hypothetical protein
MISAAASSESASWHVLLGGRRDQARAALFGNDLKSLSCRGEFGLLAGDLLEALHDLVAIGRIELDEPCTATGVMCAAIKVVPEPAMAARSAF